VATLAELAVVLGITGTVTATSLPTILAGLDDARVAGAARYLSSRLVESRMDAISRVREVAIRFTPTGVTYSFTVYVDGNHNGVLDRCDGITCPDRVLGASGSIALGGLPGAQIDTFIAYADRTSGPGDMLARPGFFLLKIARDFLAPGSAILPLPGSPVDITLGDAPILKTMACDRICLRTAVGMCAVADPDCAAPVLPADTSIRCAAPPLTEPFTPRAIDWLSADGCDAISNVYVVEDGRALPPWWPCQ